MQYAPGQAVVAAMAESVYRLQLARKDWREAIPMLDEAIAAADTLTDPASMGATRTIRTLCLSMLGDAGRVDAPGMGLGPCHATRPAPSGPAAGAGTRIGRHGLLDGTGGPPVGCGDRRWAG